jgi:hypothetical protein
MDILKDLRDGKPCRWTGVCGEMSAVGGCTCGEAADEIELLRNERDRYREALQKIYDDDSPEYIPEIMIKHLYSHYTIARDALNGEEE